MPASKFEAYRDTRCIRKAEDLAKFTIPSLMLDANRNPNGQAESVEYDYQSIGALLVNNLTAKLAGTLFPAGRPFHRLKVDARLRDMAVAQGVSTMQLEAGAAEMERLSTEQLFKNASLSKLHRALKLVIITGDCLLYRDSKRQKFLVWNMHSYAVRRNAFGEVEEIILKQRVRLGALPIELQEIFKRKQHTASAQDTVDLYTEVVYDRTGAEQPWCTVQQSIEDVLLGEAQAYPEHLCPYIVLSWNIADGEHYGRGYVEEYSGDFAKLSQLSEYLALYELESLNILNLVDESAGGIIDDYMEADVGSFVPGRTGSVTSYERGDYNKIAQVQQNLQAIEQRLARAFMYNAQQREAERVTAEEVRQVAQEAENLLGGTYSILAETLQAPLAYLCMYEVGTSSESPDVLYEVMTKQYRPEILTGIPALTQAAETQNILRAVQELQMIVPVLAEISPRFDIEAVIEKVMLNNSVDIVSISKDPEEIAREAEEAEQQQEALLGEAEAEVAEQVLRQDTI